MGKNKILTQVISFLKLSIGLILVQYLPISPHIPLFGDSRAKWAIDTGIYSLILNILFFLFEYFFYKNKLYVSVDLVNPELDGATTVNVSQNPSKINIVLKIQGKNRKVGVPISIRFPNWLDIQIKNDPAIKQISPSCILIDLDKIMGDNTKVNINRRIRVDITSNTEEQYEEMTDTSCQIKRLKRCFSINVDFTEIMIKNQWR